MITRNFSDAVVPHRDGDISTMCDCATSLLGGESYSVAWGERAECDPLKTELDIGYGSSWPQSLLWLRFWPTNTGARILSISFKSKELSYDSTWPPDAAFVAVESALLNSETYTHLLRCVSAIDSARLTSNVKGFEKFSSNSLWVAARAIEGNGALINMNWAGRISNRAEIDYAKPLAAVNFVQKRMPEAALQAHVITDSDREWASQKFLRDWEWLNEKSQYWWLRELYIETIGMVGNASVVPSLLQIVSAGCDHPSPQVDEKSRCVYLAINAITRLTGVEVRDMPVEEMNITVARKKVLNIFNLDLE